MEERDSPGPKPHEKVAVGSRGPHVLQVGTIGEFLSGAAPVRIKQELHEGLQQCWEAQWQEFLEIMQNPKPGWKSPPVPQAWPEEETQEIQGESDVSQRPRGEPVTQSLPGFGGETQERLKMSVKVEEDALGEEDVSSEMLCQRFRQFCYWEAEAPRMVCRQLRELCCRWLKPERHSKEQILELVTLEQFLRILPQEMQSWVKERNPETCAKAVAQAEDFLMNVPEAARAGGKVTGLLDKVAVNSLRSEQDPLETMKMHFSVQAKTEDDADASILEADRRVRKNKEPFQTEPGNLTAVLLGRGRGMSLHILEMNKTPGSQQGSEGHQEDHPGKATKQTFFCQEGDKGIRKSPFPGGICKHQTKTMATDSGENLHRGSDLSKDQEAAWKEKPSMCIYCEKVFMNTVHLLVHLRTHTGKSPHQYADCGQSFSRLVTHKRTHVVEERYDCAECGKTFSDGSHLRKHQRVHTGEKLYTCSQCGKVFSQRSVLWRHKRTHTGEKLHTCSDCGKGFCDKNSLNAHQRAHNGEKPFECSECGKRFGYAPNLARHKKLHTGEKPFQCLECGKHLCDKKSLIMHKRTHTGEKPYACSECGKNFRWKGSLLIHEKTHTGEKPHQCSDCGKSFCDKQSLITHRRAHTGEKPYECSKCGKRFGYAPNLIRHKKLHTGEKPYQCSQCGKWFSQLSDLLRHKTIHTREKPHKCTDCDKSFSQKASLAGHRRTHMGEKPYECSDCEKRFCSFCGFRKHQRIHTGVKPKGVASSIEKVMT